jgi:signal transduction histidine kinase
VAWLQYSWIGEVERADADRMRAALQRSADQLAGEVNSELARFYRSVLAAGRPGSGVPHVDPCQAFARWQTTVSSSRMIRGLYIRDQEDRLFECASETGERRAAEWPSDLKWVAKLWQPGPGPGPRSIAWEEHAPLMVAPYRPPGQRDGPPGVGHPGALRRWRPPLQSGAPGERPEPAEGGRQERAAGGRGEGPEGPGPHGGPGIVIAVPDDEWMGSEWMSELTRRYFGESAASDAVVRLETTATHARVFESGAWGGNAADASAQLFRVPGMFGPPDSQGSPQGYWTLLVRRRESSAAAVAARVRTRNLAVSGGVLALMAFALALLMVTIRRQRRLTQQQMEFVAGVSHELRTPVAVLSSAGENLADGIVTAPASVREYGAMIRDESRRLAGMIEQTLRFAGIQSGGAKYKLQPVDVPHVIDAALGNCEALLRESGCAVELDIAPGLPPANADSAALVHCISNLLSNAARYAASGKSITVRAGLESASEGGLPGKPARICINVEDLGPGIDPRDVPHLFEPFYRGRHIREQQIQGTGLGLALVKSIMDGLGGKVEVRTAKGQGSQFRLVVPVTEPVVELKA